MFKTPSGYLASSIMSACLALTACDSTDKNEPAVQELEVKVPEVKIPEEQEPVYLNAELILAPSVGSSSSAPFQPFASYGRSPAKKTVYFLMR